MYCSLHPLGGCFSVCHTHYLYEPHQIECCMLGDECVFIINICVYSDNEHFSGIFIQKCSRACSGVSTFVVLTGKVKLCCFVSYIIEGTLRPNHLALVPLLGTSLCCNRIRIWFFCLAPLFKLYLFPSYAC